MAVTMRNVQRSAVARSASSRSATRIQPVRAVKVEKEAKKAKEVEEVFTDGPDVAPSTFEVQQLLNSLVTDTEIAEMELKMGSFQLRVRRSESVDEAMVYVTAPKVGVFRRGKYVGGKKVGKGNVANVGDQVKRGQTLGYVEQLGTFVEVKAPQAGELAAYKAEDGDPVEYMQSLVEVLPFFGGHIIGDSKYA
eukprot:gene795-1109_t